MGALRDKKHNVSLVSAFIVMSIRHTSTNLFLILISLLFGPLLTILGIDTRALVRSGGRDSSRRSRLALNRSTVISSAPIRDHHRGLRLFLRKEGRTRWAGPSTPTRWRDTMRREKGPGGPRESLEKRRPPGPDLGRGMAHQARLLLPGDLLCRSLRRALKTWRRRQ